MVKRLIITIAIAGIGIAQPAAAADKVKVAFVSTLSGPQALLGKHMQDGFKLGVKELNGRLGGLPAEVSEHDDQFKPDVARQIADRLTKRDQVDFVTGILFSNVMLAMVNPLVDAKTIVISANAGPSQLAGKMCSPYFFSAAWQNDLSPEAVAQSVQQAGHKRVFVISSNYAAGQDMVNGF